MDVRRNSQGHELNAGCRTDRGIFRLIRTYLLPCHNEPNGFEGEEAARQPARLLPAGHYETETRSRSNKSPDLRNSTMW